MKILLKDELDPRDKDALRHLKEIGKRIDRVLATLELEKIPLHPFSRLALYLLTHERPRRIIV